jgi:hypothetical protein
MFSQHIEHSSLISLINISKSRIALQVARKIAQCNMALIQTSINVIRLSFASADNIDLGLNNS